MFHYDVINKKTRKEITRNHLKQFSIRLKWVFGLDETCYTILILHLDVCGWAQCWFCNLIRHQKLLKQYKKNIKSKANPLKALSFAYTFNLFSYREYDPSCGKIVTNLIILFIAPLSVVKTMQRDNNMDQ